MAHAVLKKIEALKGKTIPNDLQVSITRHYGDPSNGIHAVQLELSEVTYMEEKEPFRFLERKARQLRPQLRTLLELYLAIGGKNSGQRP